MDWLSALKEWRSKGGKGIPRKGTDAYNEVKAMMGGAKSAGPATTSGGPLLMETAGGLKSGKGIEAEKKPRKKRVSKKKAEVGVHAYGGGKGPILKETPGGFKTDKGIAPMKMPRKKKMNPATHHPSGRKIRSDKGQKRVVKARSPGEKAMLEKSGPEHVKKYRKAKKQMKSMMAPGESYHVQVDAKGKVVKKQIKNKAGEVMVEV
jgi:hypothetical protein